MTPAVFVILLVAAAAAVFILRPLFRADATRSERAGREAGRARELHSEQEMLLASLKDLEDDRATDKIGEEDYRELRARLSAQAVQVMKELDRLEAEERQRSRPIPHPKAKTTGPPA